MSGGFETLPTELAPGVHTLFPVQGSCQPFGVLAPGSSLPPDHPGANGDRYFTIQRVNGNGANGKNEGVGGGHRHTLEDSDRVKKNSVQRHILKQEKERKKAAVCLILLFGMRVLRVGWADPRKSELGYVTVSITSTCHSLRLILTDDHLSNWNHSRQLGLIISRSIEP